MTPKQTSEPEAPTPEEGIAIDSQEVINELLNKLGQLLLENATIVAYNKQLVAAAGDTPKED